VSLSAERAAQPRARYAFVDALRGIAATWVVFYHAYNKNLAPMTGYHLPAPLDATFNVGYLGVYIFFVISGFVIAQSIRGATITPTFLGRFALRRSLRLDPPYWATIIAMIALSYVSGHLQHDHAARPMPTAAAVVAHVFYLQAYLGYPQIVDVFWTLCYEVQFYLVLVILTGVVAWQARLLRSRWTLFAPLWLFSAACICTVAQPDGVQHALFAFCWPYFFVGVVLNWVHNREQPPIALLITALATALLVVFSSDPRIVAKVTTALVTAGLVYVVSVRGQLASLTLGRFFQYLGRISYSLYLVHMLVGTPLVRFGLRHLPGHGTGFGPAMLLIAVALAVSIAAAHILYIAIERPAVRWSHRFVRMQS
jgi:peptidoglycan/LPS O-acetylase OafA/YrhL